MDDENKIEDGIMKKGTRVKFFSAVGGAIVALSLTMLLGVILAVGRIQEYLTTISVLVVAVIIGFYFIFFVANS